MANAKHCRTPVFRVEKIFILIHPNVSESNVVNGLNEIFITFEGICVTSEYMADVRARDNFYRTTAEPRLHRLEINVNKWHSPGFSNVID